MLNLGKGIDRLKEGKVMVFQHEDLKIYVKDEQDKIIALVTWHLKDEIAVVDHTFVDESLRGQGVASKLMKEAVRYFREKGYKTYGTCSYADVWYRKNRENLLDVLVDRPKEESISCKLF